MSHTIQVITTITPVDGKGDEIHKILCDLSVQVQASEPGCIAVDVMYHQESGQYLIMERFKDQAAYDFHYKQPYVLDFQKSKHVAECFEGLDMKRCSVVEGTFMR